MSFAIGLSLVLGVLSAGLGLVLIRRRVWIPLTLGLVVTGISLFWFLMPVCVPIPEKDLSLFDPPIETREEVGMVGQRYFQQRDGNWYHCKARIARQLFF